jgi:hypothetical protein
VHRISPLILALSLACGGCGGDDPKPGPVVPAPAPVLNHGSPRGLALSIFAIAKSGNLAALAGVADPVQADGDAKQVANVSKASAPEQNEFKSGFATGTVTAEKIEGDNAEVEILFGPDGKRKETLKMVKRDGKWYLQDF